MQAYSTPLPLVPSHGARGPRCCSLTPHAPHLLTQYNGVWHCFVGRNFGAYMTHEAGHHVYFYLGQMAVLLFKTG